MTANHQPPTVDTAAGIVRGRDENGVRTFPGVPYAAPPTGRCRFRKPAPVASWHGVRDAIEPDPAAPQKIRPFPMIDITSLVGDGGTRGDDYLTCNVWGPASYRYG